MYLIQTLILSIVEGLTEFLPVSSTGHLILASELLRLQQTEFVKSFEIIIQFGAILAVVVIYFKKLFNFKLWKNVLLAFIPSAVIGFIFYGFIKEYLIGNSQVVILSLLLGGIFMIVFEKFFKPKKSSVLSTKHYVLIGFAQSLAMIPGVSRAMATIFGGMIVGMDRKKATEFSFLLAIPTMLGATVLDLYKTGFNFHTTYYILLATGFVGSFITALITVKWLIKYIQTHNFTYFGVYRIILSLLFWLLLL